MTVRRLKTLLAALPEHLPVEVAGPGGGDPRPIAYVGKTLLIPDDETMPRRYRAIVVIEGADA